MTEVTLLLTSGNGPAECRIALGRLIEILEQEAKALAVDCNITPGPAPDRLGPKSAVATLTGKEAERLAASFEGTIRFIFKSPVRPGHKRQNWFVGVQRVDLADIGRSAPEILPAEIRFEAFRAGGPGGQHQNTTDSAIRATHIPTGLSVVCRDERSQHRNKAAAINRLRSLLQLLTNERQAEARGNLFLANKDLERGNAIRTYRL